ncbi:S-methyl-5-thioribose-1-phosphate isomerase [Oscillibacter sp.]|uniref:S-methyl-5-thioribose-1-phosphate isomerase n=1 Tax=Oscillibacter sp. TaxID=1945593 RepID=UPI0037C528E3
MFMTRCDESMPFLLRYENVAWYEDGAVRILDRRVYPAEVRFAECLTYQEVRQAVADMVTQSAGPYTAVGMGMALAAHQCRDMHSSRQSGFLKQAAGDLAHARPTTANRYGIITNRCAEVGIQALEEGKDAAQAIFASTVEALNRRYAVMQLVGDALAELIPQNGSVLTQCFGETIVGTVIRAALRNSKVFRVFCAETRPYLQGARLTAGCFAEMGFDTTVITDNMAAYVMEREGVDLFTSAADTIARDGHIANKIGTFQLAILAKHFGIPYFVTGIPDGDKPGAKDIVMELRDPAQVLSCGGISHTAPGVKAIYPSFDVTPPELISGIVTDRGVFPPDGLEQYFDGPVRTFY